MGQRSYDQHCGLAAALDVVGERWAMLIVRELSAGSRHFTELAGSMPGLSSALLSRRLRELQDAGVVQHEAPGARRAYRLTAQGRALGPALAALGAWGSRRLPDATAGGANHPQLRDPLWTLQTVAAGAYGRGRPGGGSVVNVEVDGAWYHLAPGGALARRGAHPESQAWVKIEHDALESLRSGRSGIQGLVEEGRVTVGGDRRTALRAFRSDG